MLHNLNLNFVQFSVSKVQNCIPLSPCLPPGKSLREIRFWGFAIFVQTFLLPQIMVHLLRGWSLHLSCRDVASRKMRSIFLASVFKFCDSGRCVVVGSAFSRASWQPGNTSVSWEPKMHCCILLGINLHTAAPLCSLPFLKMNLHCKVNGMIKQKLFSKISHDRNNFVAGGHWRLKVVLHILLGGSSPSPSPVKSNSGFCCNKLNGAEFCNSSQSPIWSIMWGNLSSDTKHRFFSDSAMQHMTHCCAN